MKIIKKIKMGILMKMKIQEEEDMLKLQTQNQKILKLLKNLI
jgi:hypothetical protein